MAAPSDRDHEPRGEHYFADSPSSRSRPRTIPLRVRSHDVALTTDRGTFSPDRIDPGTRFLLERAPAPPTMGRFLDLGCGYGPIAMTLALEAPDAEIVAVDVNERSRSLTAANAAALDLDNVAVRSPDAADGTFDLIWSNPPIRIGKPALHDLLLRWLGRLTPTGTAILVVNRHLGADSLQRWLGDRGHPTERLASRKGYRLLAVSAAGRVDDEA
ncbi:MAG: methyltransferase [Acidimicrobiales bacterium]|nr:methyltransferase [Acidimicrobiales bacterium]